MTEIERAEIKLSLMVNITNLCIRKMASILIDETTNDSCLSTIGSLEDAERVVMRMLDVLR